MPTFVSIIDWTKARDLPEAGVVCAAATEARPFLARRGFHSLRALGPGAERSAILIATCPDEAAVVRLAGSIVPSEDVRVESMRFDEAADSAADAATESGTWTRGEAAPPPRRARVRNRGARSRRQRVRR